LSAACPQFLQLIVEIGETKLAKKVSEVAIHNRKLPVHKDYINSSELFQEIIDMRLNAQTLKLD
jgi:hypothetical protein